MRELVVLLAAILAIGAYFSEGKPKPDLGYELLAEGPDCPHPACRAMRYPKSGLGPLSPNPRTTHRSGRAPGIHEKFASR